MFLKEDSSQKCFQINLADQNAHQSQNRSQISPRPERNCWLTLDVLTSMCVCDFL